MNTTTLYRGKRVYEFSNHLGNVLVVLTDRPIPIKEEFSNSVNHFKADYSNLQDYYPFGMLISDRTYTSQTCSTVWTEGYAEIYPGLHNYGPNWQNINSGFFIPTNPMEIVSGGNFGDGAEFQFEVAHNAQEVIIDFDYIDLSNLSSFSTLIIELFDSANNPLYFTTVPQSALYHIQLPIKFNATHCATGYRLRFTINGASNGEQIYMGPISISQKYVLNDVVCEAQGYRFGFNGQEKDNEVKGLGNSLDFGARIYDSRLGRWMSLDPLKAYAPGWNPYHSSFDNPIVFVDRDGKWPIPVITGIIGGLGNLTYGIYKVESPKQLLARAASGFIAGAVVGLAPAMAVSMVTGTAIMSATVSQFVAIVGGSGTVQIALISGVFGNGIENLVHQGIEIGLGEREQIDPHAISLNMATGWIEGIIGVGGDFVAEAAANIVTKSFQKTFVVMTRTQERELKKAISKEIAKESSRSGIKLTKKETKQAITQMLNIMKESQESTLNLKIHRLENGTVQVTTIFVETTAEGSSQSAEDIIKASGE